MMYISTFRSLSYLTYSIPFYVCTFISSSCHSLSVSHSHSISAYLSVSLSLSLSLFVSPYVGLHNPSICFVAFQLLVWIRLKEQTAGEALVPVSEAVAVPPAKGHDVLQIHLNQ